MIKDITIEKLQKLINIEEFKNDCNLITIAKLAIKYQVCTSTITMWRRILGLNNKFKKFDNQQDINSFILNYKSMTHKQLAQLYNVDTRTIERWAKKFNLNNPHPYTIIDKEKFKEEYNNHTIIELSKKYNVNRKTIREWKEKLQLKEKIKYRTKQEILDYLTSLNLTILNINDYKGIDSILICTTNLGFKVQIRIRNLLSGHLPQIFETSNPYTYKNIILYCKIFRPEYILIEKEYLGSNIKHTFKYIGNNLPEKSNPIFKIRLDSFKMGVGHPDLTRSKGELRIQFLLDENNIQYTQQYTFDDLRGRKKRHYKFDFGILKNDKLKYLIEWDSAIHYQQIDFYNNEKEFKERVERDEIKNEYCIKNNIPLLRIPDEYGYTLTINDLKLETSKYLLKGK